MSEAAEDQGFQRAPAFTTLQTHWSDGSTRDQDRKRKLVAERVRLLFGCYRQGDANDIETYTVAVASVLSIFPDEIIVDVTDPVRGLPSKLKWLPTVAEVRAECDRLQKLREPVQVRPREIESHIPEDERARVAAKMEKLQRELAPAEFRDEPTKTIAERLEKYKSEGAAGIQFSEEMRRKLALDAEQRDDLAGL